MKQFKICVLLVFSSVMAKEPSGLKEKVKWQQEGHIEVQKVYKQEENFKIISVKILDTRRIKNAKMKQEIAKKFNSLAGNRLICVQVSDWYPEVGFNGLVAKLYDGTYATSMVLRMSPESYIEWPEVKPAGRCYFMSTSLARSLLYKLNPKPGKPVRFILFPFKDSRTDDKAPIPGQPIKRRKEGIKNNLAWGWGSTPGKLGITEGRCPPQKKFPDWKTEIGEHQGKTYTICWSSCRIAKDYYCAVNNCEGLKLVNDDHSGLNDQQLISLPAYDGLCSFVEKRRPTSNSVEETTVNGNCPPEKKEPHWKNIEGKCESVKFESVN